MNSSDQNRSFEHWVQNHIGVLHHVANAFAEGDDRRDLMQELLLAVWRAIPAFRGQAQPVTFMYRVAHNTALAWKRFERNYRQRVETFEALNQSQVVPSHTAGTGDAETLRYVYAAIRRLPAIDCSLVLLHLEGLSYADIAAIHGLTESNVGARLTRLRQRLTQDLQFVSHELR